MIASICSHGREKHLPNYLKAATYLGYKPITLAAVCEMIVRGEAECPEPYLLLTLDHAVAEMKDRVLPLTRALGFLPTLYVLTENLSKKRKDRDLGWDDLCELAGEGWTIGAHTHSHVGLADYPGGAARFLEEEIEKSNTLIERHTGSTPGDFAYPGGRLGREYEDMIRSAYRTARLWTKHPFLRYDGEFVSWSDFYGAPDQAALFPRQSLYVTHDASLHRIPSVDITSAIADPAAFCAYLWAGTNESLSPETREESIRIATYTPESPPVRFDDKYCIAHVGKENRQEFQYLPVRSLEAVFATGRKTYIWGTGARYADHLRKYVNPHSFPNFKGFIDNNPRMAHQEIEGKTVFPPSELIGSKEITIIICSAFVGAISEQILSLAFEREAP